MESGMFCIMVVVFAVLLCWIFIRANRALGRWVDSGSPDAAGTESAHPAPLAPPGTIIARYPGECEMCGHHFGVGTRIYWNRGGSTKHYDCDAARRDREAAAFARLLDRLDGAKGVATRRNVIAQADTQIQDSALRTRLLIEASRLDAEAALERAESLKSLPAKRRRLQEALDSIRSDPVPDELQAEQIAWLEEALAKLELDASAS